MAPQPTHVLLVEDNPDDADLLQEYLSEASTPFVVSVVGRLAEAVKWLERLTPDVILLDLSLPDASGLDTFVQLRDAAGAPPIIVVTGLDDRDLALQAVQQGAQDYLVKGDLHGNTLAPAVRYAIERKRLEARLRHSESQYRALVENTSGGVWSIDAGAVTTFVNRQMAAMLGYEPQDMLGKPLADFMSQAAREECERLMARRRQGISEVHDFDFLHRDGSVVHTIVATAAMADPRGDFVGATAFVTDVSERHHQDSVLRACTDVRAAVWGMHTPDDVESLRTAVSAALETMGMPHRAYSINLPESGDEDTSVELVGGSSVTGALDALATSSGWDNVRTWWQAGETVYRRDLLADDPYGEAGHASELCGYPVRSMLDVPFSHGTIAVNSDRPNAFADHHIEALQSLAQVLSEGFRRLDDLRALQDKEEQLRQSQKMEAIGRLAGGVAHDFNNLITVIKGYGQTLRKRVGGDERAASAVEQVIRAGDRAAGLVRQLLAFSRRQVLQPEDIDVGALISDLEKMLRRLIGEDVDLITATAAGLGRIHADPGQIEQVVINLVVNARDAMPHGGRLTVEADNVHLDRAYVDRRIEVDPGDYVVITVSDTGQGMDEDTQAQIFEPFFTTKEHGTGLGLSTVYGIVRQSDGYIWPYSQVGTGTTLKVYLPRVDVPAGDRADGTDDVAEAATCAHGTILLVEDEDMVRELARDTLEDAGFTVLEAAEPARALDILAQPGTAIDLLVTDVVMPGMNGPELAACVTEHAPDVPVLFTSGYMDREIVASGVIAAGTPFLQKPFNPDDLVRQARELLAPRAP